jgi:uncharacterized small protein (DUF1192 family)
MANNDNNLSPNYVPTITNDSTVNTNLDDIRRTINELSRRISIMQNEINILKGGK